MRTVWWGGVSLGARLGREGRKGEGRGVGRRGRKGEEGGRGRREEVGEDIRGNHCVSLGRERRGRSLACRWCGGVEAGEGEVGEV